MCEHASNKLERMMDDPSQCVFIDHRGKAWPDVDSAGVRSTTRVLSRGTVNTLSSDSRCSRFACRGKKP